MEICMAIKAGGWTVVQDPTAKRGPYAFKVINKDKDFHCYTQQYLRKNVVFKFLVVENSRID